MKRRSNTDTGFTSRRLDRSFYTRDVLEVARDIIGKFLVVRNAGGEICRAMVTEAEAYRGKEDKACHASKGRTARTEVMYHIGGKVYVYFVYGMYWMLNIVTGPEDEPQAVLIRGVEGINGPGKLTREIGIDGSFYGLDMTTSDRVWMEDHNLKPEIKAGPRVGIGYSGEPWISKPWRFLKV